MEYNISYSVDNRYDYNIDYDEKKTICDDDKHNITTFKNRRDRLFSLVFLTTPNRVITTYLKSIGL